MNNLYKPPKNGFIQTRHAIKRNDIRMKNILVVLKKGVGRKI